MRFDLIDLQLFVEIAEARSITHGAERMNLALAAASSRVKQLEILVGSPLFVRSRRGVTMTALGETFRDHTRVVLADVERMSRELAARARGLKATIHLLTNTAGLSEHLPQPLASFLRAHPEVNIKVEERDSANIVAAIGAGAADLGIAIDRDIPAHVTHYPFRTDRLMLVVPARDKLARRRTIAFEEVASRAFVGLDEASALQSYVAAQASRLGTPLTYRARMKGLDAVCQMVGAGVGLGIVPEATVRRCARTTAIRALAIKADWATRNLVICVRDPSRLSSPVRSLVSHLGRR